VKHLLKSVVREIRTLRSVGTGGGQLPPVTRWAVRDDRLYRDSKFKSILRTIAARTREALDDGISYALNAVTPSDSRGWFEHSGCLIHAA
jgi:hypothetical protein